MNLRNGIVLMFAAALAGCSGSSKPPAHPAQPATTAPANKHPDRPDQGAILAPGSILHANIPYTTAHDPLRTLDIYSPANAHGDPLVIYVHGGEWSKGDKTEVSFKPKFFNENGIIFVSINYRLSPAATHPAQVDDLASAVRWVKDHASDYGGDSRNIFVMGHSAGCHLVTLLGLDPRPLATVGLKPSDLQGVISWSGGAFDLVDKVHSGGMYAHYIRATFGDKESQWLDASPVEHVGESQPMPPFLIVSGEQDKPASIEACNHLANLIHVAGGTVQQATLPGKDHFNADYKLGAPGDDSGQLLLKFIHGLPRQDAR